MASAIFTALFFLLFTWQCFMVSSLSGQLPKRAAGGRLGEEFRASRNQSLFKNGELKWFTAPLDHFNSSLPSFQNKYYIDDSMWDGSGPAFFKMGQEAGLEGIGSGFVSVLAQSHHALIVAIEHRFYGDSIPFQNLSVPYLQYLSVEQALLDSALLMDILNSEYAHNFTWFTFGGSYSGALSSFFRTAYPDYTHGSLSSSGVVNAIMNFSEFDTQVGIAVGPDCANTLRQITSVFEFENAQEGGAGRVRAMFGVREGLGDQDLFYMMADALSMAVQYGHKAELCSEVSAGGPLASNATLMQLFVNFTVGMYGPSFPSDCYYDTQCLAFNVSQWTLTDARAWRWQTCYELAYFQIAPAVGSIRSSIITLQYHLDQCAVIFGPIYPNTAGINARYGGASPKGSQIFFSDFSDDPWKAASVNHTVSTLEPYQLVTCDGCGHCMDLYAPSSSDPPQLTAERTSFETFLDSWLTS